jgi:hypothetical protein
LLRWIADSFPATPGLGTAECLRLEDFVSVGLSKMRRFNRPRRSAGGVCLQARGRFPFSMF